MDFAVRVFRTLALVRRLQIIRHVLRHPNVTVGAIVEALGIPPPDASKHVRRLAAHGLLQTRPSGKFVLVHGAEPIEPANALLLPLTRLLAKYLRDASLPQAVAAICPQHRKAKWEDVLDHMCFEFTGYTFLRRLLVLRLLADEGGMDVAMLMSRIGMSQAAVNRQVDKLVRRGLVCEAETQGGFVVQLPSTFGTQFREELFRAVRAQLSSAPVAGTSPAQAQASRRAR